MVLFYLSASALVHGLKKDQATSRSAARSFTDWKMCDFTSCHAGSKPKPAQDKYKPFRKSGTATDLPSKSANQHENMVLGSIERCLETLMNQWFSVICNQIAPPLVPPFHIGYLKKQRQIGNTGSESMDAALKLKKTLQRCLDQTAASLIRFVVLSHPLRLPARTHNFKNTPQNCAAGSSHKNARTWLSIFVGTALAYRPVAGQRLRCPR